MQQQLATIDSLRTIVNLLQEPEQAHCRQVHHCQARQLLADLEGQVIDCHRQLRRSHSTLEAIQDEIKDAHDRQRTG